MDSFLAVLATLATSFVPVLELRAGIPIGLALGLSPATATAVAVAGNVLQIPLAIAAIARAYRECSRAPRIGAWLAKTERQVLRYAPLIKRWGWLGLIAFILIPLPGTGVWGGVVLSRLLQVPVGGLWLGVSIGVALSGALLTLSIQGVITLIR